MSDEKLGQCQIQITPVDDGFVIQAGAIDGKRKSVKLVADSVTVVRAKMHKIVDQLFEPVPEPPVKTPAPPIAVTGKADAIGPAGTQSPS
jgi:hypothetical protein